MESVSLLLPPKMPAPLDNAQRAVRFKADRLAPTPTPPAVKVMPKAKPAREGAYLRPASPERP
jgi:hypothetical protein